MRLALKIRVALRESYLKVMQIVRFRNFSIIERQQQLELWKIIRR
jgi:hypothetical protein